MQSPPLNLIEACKKEFDAGNISGKWPGSGIPVDYDALSRDVIRHYHTPPVICFSVIIRNFVADYPVVYSVGLHSSNCLQEEFFRYLDQAASRKFFSAPIVDPLEISQETKIIILKKVDTFHYRSRFRTWCVTILIRIGIRMVKKGKKRLDRESISLDAPIGDDGASRQEVTASPMANPESQYINREIYQLIVIGSSQTDPGIDHPCQ